ncbi:MAG TPA: hypothetical protein VK808_07705, partial [Bacteroidia bacterium]|nr:hypothetical protein [Bacteroidia bacterium]
MRSKTVIGGYAEGLMYPDPRKDLYNKIKEAGWTSIILSLFHINEKGSIRFNKVHIVEGGNYIGTNEWPEMIADLKQNSTINTISASIGGWSVADFANIRSIYTSNNNSFDGTALKNNFLAFRKSFPAIDIIDLDCEETYDQASFVAFCKMLIGMGFGITFCPYTFISFWVDALIELENYKKGAVKYWNTQCYIGGTPNIPRQWANAISYAMPDFNTDGFIISGDRCRIPGRAETSDCPAQVAARLREFDGPYLGGGFIWTIDYILKHQDETTAECGGKVKMEDYVEAIAS